MKIKSYYSRTVEDAIASARSELGPEAMLVNSRRAPIQHRHLGECEVVFALLGPGEGMPDNPVGTKEPEGRPEPLSDRLSSEVADLKRELEGMRRVLTRAAYGPQQWPGASQDAAEAFGVLSEAEISGELARDIIESASQRLTARPGLGRASLRGDAGAFSRAVAEEITSRFSVEPQLGRGQASPRIVALVGPPGCGKTTSLVKLAANYGLAAKRPVLLLSMDTYRIAAAAQLRSFAAILGVGFQVLETVGALAQALEESRNKELILIDTPGLGAGDLDDFRELSHFLWTREDIDTQLVLPASMKPTDLTRTVTAFTGRMRPNRLLFTKLDETASYGPILNEAARTRRPLSFFTTGQRIPEDLEAAAAPRLLELLTGANSSSARVA